MDLREIEEANSLDIGVIKKARWVKPILRCRPTQTCGHLIFSFSNAHTTNEALKNSLFICQKKVYVEKCKKEPLRCMKCHGWNHMAADCAKEINACSTCTHQHRKADCVNQSRPHCIPCSEDSHTSWDRNCPVFQCKCVELNERTEDNQMPYYHTSEP
jgi:hypothetical protein